MVIPSLKDYVYDYISSEIQNGNLKSGDKINEQIIGEKLNISRTPVREALIQLSTEGFLESMPRRGFRVHPITKKEAEDLYAVIADLDAMAAQLSTRYLQQEDFVAMKQLTEEMDQKILSYDFTVYYRLQMEFHNLYIRKCGNQALIDILQRLRKRFIRQTYVNNKDPQLQKLLFQANDQHKQLIEMLRGKKVEEVRDFLIQTHWSLNYAELDSFDN